LNLPAIIVHGGAWYIAPDRVEAYGDGCRRAATEGWSALLEGASALDAVELAVRILEDDPTYDAGRGSYFNKEGVVQLDAIIMDGASLDFGAVGAVERVRHPISLARAVLQRGEHRFVVGRGAESLSESLGLPLCSREDLLGKGDDGGWAPPSVNRLGGSENSLPRGYAAADTVGAVAIDTDGHLAVATSTGGTPDKWPGRIGDSPLVGCGAYADDLVGAAAATGSGEALMRIVTSKTAVDYLAQGMDAQEAAETTIGLLWKRTRGYGGVIVIDREGRIGLAHNTPNLSYAYAAAGQDPVSGTEISPVSMPGRQIGLSAIRG